jgi:hypothetical protein
LKTTRLIDLSVPLASPVPVGRDGFGLAKPVAHGAALVVCLLVLSGCSQAPRAVTHPVASGSTCAAEALKLYDKNGDSALDGDELKACPGLQAAVERVDTDHDRKLSAEEIAKRIDDLRSSTAVVITAIVAVRRGGAPLSGAQIVVEPEPFMEGLPMPAVAVTDDRGEVSLAGQNAKFSGLYCGMYRVRVSKQQQGRETIPARYNTETTLGFELARDVPGLSKIQFDLK